MRWWNHSKLEDLQGFVHSEAADHRIEKRTAQEINNIIQSVLEDENTRDIDDIHSNRSASKN